MPLGAARVVNPGMRTFLDKKLFENDVLTGGVAVLSVVLGIKLKI